jgi:hypothetical protein
MERGYPYQLLKLRIWLLEIKHTSEPFNWHTIFYHYLTPKGLAEMEKIQRRTIKVGLSESVFSAGFEQTEIKGNK